MAVQKRTFSLPAEQANYIDAKVAQGEFTSASEVVRAGIRALKERDEAIERWLREEVAPTYDAMIADPSRTIDSAAVWENIRARYEQRTKSGR